MKKRLNNFHHQNSWWLNDKGNALVHLTNKFISSVTYKFYNTITNYIDLFSKQARYF